MKNIFSGFGGAVELNEENGVFTLVVAESKSIGGGEAAGVVKVKGDGSVELDAVTALKLGEALLNSHLPVSVKPLALVIEGVANQAVAALE